MRRLLQTAKCYNQLNFFNGNTGQGSMRRGDFLFTSESVSEGHPDKICDQISDAVLDALLRVDSQARCACEVLVKDNYVVCAGEVSARSSIDYDAIIRGTVRKIGYTDEALGFCCDSCAITLHIGTQSRDIAGGVDKGADEDQGAGDQGLVFGYACDETEQYMPAPIYYAHRLVKAQSQARKNGSVDIFRPDAKSQLTFRYSDGKPVAVETIVLSTQHTPEATPEQIKEAVMETVIRPVLSAGWLRSNPKIHINPTGRFEIGGPKGDCGLTGRKVIVDTYGGMARHGGGAFSGKDPSKVDRSAAYAARYIAKNVVAAGLAQRCEIQIAYAIGVAQPVSVAVNTFATGIVSDAEVEMLIRRHFNLSPRGIIHDLDLLRPVYQPTAAYGHFGRNGFAWEQCDMIEQLRQ